MVGIDSSGSVISLVIDEKTSIIIVTTVYRTYLDYTPLVIPKGRLDATHHKALVKVGSQQVLELSASPRSGNS